MSIRMRSLLALPCAIATFGLVWAQQPAKPPQPKSQKELTALQAVQNAKSPDEQIKAIENVLTNFADTDFKGILLFQALQIELQKGDYAQIMFYGERMLDADPKNAFALVTMAGETARRTREFDLDKEEKLAKVDKWAQAAIEAAKDMPKPSPQVPDEQWANARKDFQAQAYAALGMSAALRKKYDDAVTDYKQALSVEATPDSTVWVRLGQVYLDANKLDDASAAFDKALNDATAPASVKQIAQSKKDEVAKKKAAGAPKPPGE